MPDQQKLCVTELEISPTSQTSEAKLQFANIKARLWSKNPEDGWFSMNKLFNLGEREDSSRIRELEQDRIVIRSICSTVPMFFETYSLSKRFPELDLFYAYYVPGDPNADSGAIYYSNGIWARYHADPDSVSPRSESETPEKMRKAIRRRMLGLKQSQF